MEVITVRSVRLGPTDAVVVDTTIVGVHFKIPAGATLIYAAIGPSDAGIYPRQISTITLYHSKDEATTGYPYPLKTGYSYKDAFRPRPLVWEGKHKLNSNYEHTLELSVYNQSGASITIRGLCVYEEVDEIDR